MARGESFRNLFRTTPGDKAGSIDGLNLFFGALLGANLGTMQNLQLTEYTRLILLLAGSVMALRMLSTSEKRWKVAALIVLCVVAVGGIVFSPAQSIKGLSADSLHKLIATLAIWLVCVLLVEFSPGTKDARAEPSQPPVE
jgi:peptidoglycan/LPS O-acetylase OafA/YrhL